MKIETLVESILEKYKEMPAKQCLLAGISGIDASGKGFVTARLADQIRRRGFNVANINIDGWLDLPEVRFDARNPAENFYENAIRFSEMFDKLIFPLKENGSVNLTADFAEETADRFRKHEYVYRNIDLILVEGIFLFKNELVNHFDLKIWIDCSFETALTRAVARAQEGLSEAETVRAYREIYFPAQKIHFAKDRPQEAADLVWHND